MEHRPEGVHADIPVMKKRTRASVACNNCRVKRSKCDGAVVGAPCSQCRKYGLHCELRQNQKRQKPSNAVLVEDLTERVKMLERLLDITKRQNTGQHETDADKSKSQNAAHATSDVQPNTTRGTAEGISILQFQSSEDSEPDVSFTDASVFDNLDEENLDGADALDGFDVVAPTETDLFTWCIDDNYEKGIESDETAQVTGSSLVLNSTMVGASADANVLQDKRRIARTVPDTDNKKRRQRTAGTQADAKSPACAAMSTAPISTIQFPGGPGGGRTMILDDSSSISAPPVPGTLVNGLLDLYFTHFQTMLKIIDEASFREAWAMACRNRDDSVISVSPSSVATNPLAYRESLALAMMAAGARFSKDPLLAAKYRIRSSCETVFARRSKKLLESEVGHADITTVQALLILGELETSAGNEMSGCMYSGLVSRLIFDLRLDPASSQDLNLSDSDRSVRHWILWYASVQDKYWAQRLCRPLTIKNMDLQLSRMIERFSQQLSSHKRSTSFENVVQECVLDLLELTREALEFIVGSFSFRVSVDSYATVLRINSKLDLWFRNLPQVVKDSNNTNNTNHFVPVLHMQYHLTKIQLFEPFAFYYIKPTASPSTPSSPTSASELAMTQIIHDCRRQGAASSVHIARLFATFRRKYDIRCLQCSGVQYADIASHFLVKYIPLLPPDEVVEPEAHLRSLSRTLEAMSETFQPATKPLHDATNALYALELRQRSDIEKQSPIPHGSPHHINALQDHTAVLSKVLYCPSNAPIGGNEPDSVTFSGNLFGSLDKQDSTNTMIANNSVRSTDLIGLRPSPPYNVFDGILGEDIQQLPQSGDPSFF